MTSRLLAWSRARIAKGKCGTCGARKIAPGSRSKCRVCREVARRVDRHKTGSKPWVAGKRGRPPQGAKP